MGGDIPSDKWSFFNRIVMSMHDTDDARGFKQWHEVDDRLNGLKPGQKNDQEIIAEFGASVIKHLMGYKIPLGNVREYIESYSFRELLIPCPGSRKWLPS